MSLPEFILERARSSAGDTRRLHDIFQRLESGMQCSPLFGACCDVPFCSRTLPETRRTLTRDARDSKVPGF